MPIASSPAVQESPSAPAAVNPFVRAATEHRQNFHDRTTAIGSSAVQVGPIDVAAHGFMRNIVLEVETDGTGAGASTFREDAPWNVLQNISLEDVNGRPIVGPLDGYDLYLINKWGGLGAAQGVFDPASYPSYELTTTAGVMKFKLRIPVEITSRDGLGSLPNLTASATYKLKYTVAAEGTVWSSAPATTTPGVRVRAWLESWSQPRATDARNVANETMPPMVGTTQFWSKQSVNVSAGEQRIKFTRMGNLLRNLVLIYRDDAGTPVRTSGEFPDDFRIEWDNKIKTVGNKVLWRDEMYERYGQTNDTGVFVEDFIHDADGRPGNENRHGYIPTVQGTRYELIGTFGGSGGVLTVLTNDIAPAANVTLDSGNPRG